MTEEIKHAPPFEVGTRVRFNARTIDLQPDVLHYFRNRTGLVERTTGGAHVVAFGIWTVEGKRRERAPYTSEIRTVPKSATLAGISRRFLANTADLELSPNADDPDALAREGI